jgi:hypothetical protein
MTQRFYVLGHNIDTGEKWEVSVSAQSPERALATVLRRRMWAEWLLSEQPFRFVVSHVPVSMP